MNYLEKHKSCGIKIGDRVKVVRKAESYEDGWDDAWVTSMNNFVGEICLVMEDNDECGFYLKWNDTVYSFPYFVLEKVGEENTIQNISSCPNCNGELKDHYSEWAGKDIKKCKLCGWC